MHRCLPDYRSIALLAVTCLCPARLPAQSNAVEIWASSAHGAEAVPWESIADAWIEGDRIFVLDRASRTVVALSLDGYVVGSGGRAGQGPGEFSDPTDLTVFAGVVRVEDGRNLRVSTFDATDLRHLDTRRHEDPPVAGVAWSRPLRDGRTVFMSSTFVDLQGAGRSRVFLVGPTGAEEVAAFERLGATILYEGESRLSLGPAPAGPTGAAVVLGDSVVVVLDGLEGRLDVRPSGSTMEGPPPGRLVLPHRAERASPEDRQLLIELGLGDILSDSRTSDPRAPEVLSGWTALEAGSQGTVWARRGGSEALRRTAEEWWRFALDESRAPVVLRLPDGARALHFRDGWVVGVRTTEVGEERLVLLRWS